MDFASLMAQIHASGVEDYSVDEIIAMSTPADQEEEDLNAALADIPGIDTAALRDYLVDYLDMLAMAGVGGSNYDLMEIDRLTGFQLVELCKKYGVELDQFRAAE